MNFGFGKFYSKTFTGSMVGAGADVFAVWGYCIANASPPYGTVELNPKLLSTLLGMSKTAIQKAIEYLAAPDPNSRSKSESGRRIVQVGQYEFQLVNWTAHRKIKDDDARREYMQKYMVEYRKSMEGKTIPAVNSPVNICKLPLAQLAQAEAEAEAEAEAVKEDSQLPAATDPLLAEWRKFKGEWNALADKLNLPKISDRRGTGNQNRYRSFRTRCSDKSWLEDWPKAVVKIQDSPFLKGDNQRGWRANVDWFLRPGTVEKILEGTYEAAKGGGATQSGDWRAQQDKDLRSAVGEAFEKGGKKE